MNSKKPFGALTILLTVCATLFCTSVYGATVLGMDTQAMLGKSQLVFEGQVASVQPRWNDTRTSISTHVTFYIDDVIKGHYEAASLTLEFSGGTVDGMTLTIDGMRYPVVGEKGIYFVHSIDQVYINPLVGWSQGTFKIQQDANGVDRVTTDEQAPVTGLATSAENRARRSVHSDHERDSESLPLDFSPFSSGVATDIETAAQAEGLSQAMTKQAFKEKLREMAGRLP